MGNIGPSGFGKKSTAEQVAQHVDLRGKVCIVTGANTGVGYESARVMCMRGAHVIVVCRSQDKANATAASITRNLMRRACNARITPMVCELGSFRSIAAFAEEFLAKGWPLHILMCNAGVMAIPDRAETENGFEMQIGVNHFGHFYLTQLLLERIKESAPARIVSVSSGAHRGGKMKYEDINSHLDYSTFGAYQQSKLANILWAKELNRRLEGTGVTVNAIHPGFVATELGKQSTLMKAAYAVSKPLQKNLAEGAATQVYVATSGALDGVGGLYFEDCNVEEPVAAARDMVSAGRLWELSEQLVREVVETGRVQTRPQVAVPQPPPQQQRVPVPEQEAAPTGPALAFTAAAPAAEGEAAAENSDSSSVHEDYGTAATRADEPRVISGAEDEDAVAAEAEAVRLEAEAAANAEAEQEAAAAMEAAAGDEIAADTAAAEA